MFEHELLTCPRDVILFCSFCKFFFLRPNKYTQWLIEKYVNLGCSISRSLYFKLDVNCGWWLHMGNWPDHINSTFDLRFNENSICLFDGWWRSRNSEMYRYWRKLPLPKSIENIIDQLKFQSQLFKIVRCLIMKYEFWRPRSIVWEKLVERRWKVSREKMEERSRLQTSFRVTSTDHLVTA